MSDRPIVRRGSPCTPAEAALWEARRELARARTMAARLAARIDVAIAERQVVRERKAAEWRELERVADEHPIRDVDVYDAPSLFAGAANYTERD